ncbi:MAG: hypothetical protein ABGX04_17530 [Myxococcales bacterium]|nr:hypothetical protein [Myxococcales bacterium]HIL81139.1 hypothetical protein [Myxococcales bacterium]
MADRGLQKRLWIPLLTGLAFTAVVLWWTTGSEQRALQDSVEESSPNGGETSNSRERRENIVPALRLSAGKRLTIAEQNLPEDGFLALALDLSDEARGTGPKRVLVVSTTAGRIETEATALPGVESGMRLEIGRDFLARGLYMIEIETEDGFPQHFRRFVLAIE